MSVRVQDLKAGMKVKLVDEIPEERFHYNFTEDMTRYLGKVCTVKEVIIWAIKGILIKEDKDNLFWDIRLIEKIIDDKEKKNKVYTSFGDIKKDSIEEDYYKLKHIYWEETNLRYEFEKCIVNDNCVIGIFKCGTRTYKGIAKCQPDDEFSLAKGLTIAMLRAYKDYLDREIKSLY